jgi:hypothetical protein
VTDALLTSELIDGFRGFASGLRDEPIYRAYARLSIRLSECASIDALDADT